MSRPWLIAVWQRTFVTEDEADEAYEQFLEWCHPPLEVDRFDGNTIRVYLDTKMLEARAQMVEVQAEVPTLLTPCDCGHMAVSHRGEDASCAVSDCNCRGFERQMPNL